MKRYFPAAIIILTLTAIMILSGCTTANIPEDDKKAEQTQAPSTDNSAVAPTQSPEPQDNDQDNEDTADEQTNKELLALLPEKEGYKWVYNGYAEYGHDMTIDKIETTPQQTVYTLNGEVFDMSDGATDRDYSLKVTYTITSDALIQDKSADMMLDSFDHMELVRAPLTEGGSWEQTVKDAEGNSITLECTIEKIETEDGVKVYTVMYKDKNSPYYEKRTIREGTGVINYMRLYLTEEGNYEISYFLYEEASGYDK